VRVGSGEPERREAGFTLVEMLVATAIFGAAFVVLFQLASTGQRVARAQPDAADMRQRLRVAADMIQRDLLMAGAGLVHGADAGPLVNYLPAVLPLRTGARKPDPELSFFDDRVSIIYAEAGAAAAPLATNMATAVSAVPIETSAAGCPSAGLCGFEDGTRSLIVDTSGAGLGFDLFSVSGTSGALAHGAPDPDFARAYPAAGTRVVPIRQRVYYFDAPTKRLMIYDGYQTDVPLAENIVLLKFEYFVDPWASSVPRPKDGEGNCLYTAASPPTPLLTDLGGPLLLPASAPLLTDGPLCGLAPHRFDGDLLRVRRIRVTIRAQVADRSLRGSGADFATSGVSSDGASYVPDIEVTFDVTPRNLQPTK
jgi:prepilin-type N-terminal cleavage/methylation domain-containing protein